MLVVFIFELIQRIIPSGIAHNYIRPSGCGGESLISFYVSGNGKRRKTWKIHN
jgi:hypothetical protein